MPSLRYAAFRFPAERPDTAERAVASRLDGVDGSAVIDHYRVPTDDHVLGWVVVDAGGPSSRAWADAWDSEDGGLELISAGSLKLLSEDGSLEGVEPTHLLPVTYTIDGADLDDLDEWYVQEHAGLLLTCPDWHRVRRCATSDVVGNPWTRVILHDLTSAAVLQTPEIVASMNTEWRTRLAETSWFLAGGREILERQD